MQQRVVVRAVKLAGLRNAVLLSLYGVAEDGKETLAATSAPVTKVAAAAICRLFDAQRSVKQNIESLARVFQIYGKTAWAGFTARDAWTAAQHACQEHDLSQARGVLAIVTLALDSNIVDTVGTVLDVVRRHAAVGVEMTQVVTYDANLEGEVKVELLLLGL